MRCKSLHTAVKNAITGTFAGAGPGRAACNGRHSSDRGSKTGTGVPWPYKRAAIAQSTSGQPRGYPTGLAAAQQEEGKG